MRLYDTARQEVTALEPAAGPGGALSMYTCGVTPYDAAHLGHAATYIAYDVIQRRLRDLGYRTRLVRNVTDVDDDILRKARELDVYYLDLADRGNGGLLGRHGRPWAPPRGQRAPGHLGHP